MTGFAEHCSEVILNALSQLSALYNKDKRIINTSDIHQNVFLDKICNLFAVLITLDSVIHNQGTLKEHWSTYKRVINAANMDPEKYNTEKEKMQKVRKLLAPTDKIVMNSHIFRSSVLQGLDRNGIKITDNTILGDEFIYYLKSKLTELEEATTKGTPNQDDMLKFVGFCAFFVLHTTVYFNTDKKVVSKMLDLCKKLPSISLYGNVMWFPEQFLLEHLPALAQNVDKKIWSSFSPNRQNYLQTKSSSAIQDIKQYHLQLNGWMMQMEEALTRRVNNLTLDHLQRVATLLLQGLEIADPIRVSVSTILNLHGKLSKVANK